MFRVFTNGNVTLEESVRKDGKEDKRKTSDERNQCLLLLASLLNLIFEKCRIIFII